MWLHFYVNVNIWRVGVREAKAHLSEYLRRVQSGEEFVITDHGKPVARITPIDSPIEFSPEVAKGIREGWIRQPTRLGPLPPLTLCLGDSGCCPRGLPRGT